MNRIARATGATIVSRLEDLRESDVGTQCGIFRIDKIGDEYYWDGGYSGNPAIFPLFYHTKSRGILIIHTNPIERDEIPKTIDDIHNRIIEITFNASLLKEIRAVTFVQKLLRERWLKPGYRGHFKDILLHSIRGDKTMCELSVPSKFNTDWDFLMYLFTKGCAAAEVWIQENYSHLGKNSTVDLYREFLQADDRRERELRVGWVDGKRRLQMLQAQGAVRLVRL